MCLVSVHIQAGALRSPVVSALAYMRPADVMCFELSWFVDHAAARTLRNHGKSALRYVFIQAQRQGPQILTRPGQCLAPGVGPIDLRGVHQRLISANRWYNCSLQLTAEGPR
jgi:hypothetical protein